MTGRRPGAEIRPATSFVIGKQAEHLIRDMVALAGRHGIPFYVETHRGRVTQDLHRTIDYVEAIPELKLTLDLSHYVVAGEMTVISEQAKRLFARLLLRTACIHGRISNGQQVQLSLGSPAVLPLIEVYGELWTKAMKHWRQGAKPGDRLPVLPEFGPPPYAITHHHSPEPRDELADRWEQSLLMKALFEQLWEKIDGSVER